MLLQVFVTCAALVGTFSARTKVDAESLKHDLDVNASSSTNLCSSWLVVEYGDGTKAEGSTFGSFRFDSNSWSEVVIYTKTEADGCVKTYTAKCQIGSVEVEKACDGKATTTETRSLRFVHRKTDLGKSETLDVHTPDEGVKHLTTGKVRVFTINPSKGISLKPAPGRGNWKAEPGCYCCKHSYIIENPFSMSSGRMAWRTGSDGNMECMLAWKMIGNGMNDDNPADSSFLGVLAMIPETILTIADMMTLTIGRSMACASTCAFRKARYEQNKYSFSKVQTGQDMY